MINLMDRTLHSISDKEHNVTSRQFSIHSTSTELCLAEFYTSNSINVPIPMVSRSKAWVFGRSLAGIVGSNPARGNGCLSVVDVVCCQVCASG
jgi:hypothetical protein